jgi:hypothetical protein
MTAEMEQWYASQLPPMEFESDVAPVDENDPPPGWTGKLVTVGAIGAEVAISLVPGGDLYDLFKEYIWKPFVNGEPPNNVVGVISLVGFLADGGYLAGPFGAAANLVAGVAKCVFKYVSPELVTAMIKMSGTALDSIKLIGDYINRIPSPPGAGVVQTAIAKVQALTNQLQKVIYGPLNIGAEHLTAAFGFIAKRGSKSFSVEAMDGAAALVKAGKKEAAEHLFDEFADDVIESTFAAHRGLASQAAALRGAIFEARAAKAIKDGTLGSSGPLLHTWGILRSKALSRCGSHVADACELPILFSQRGRRSADDCQQNPAVADSLAQPLPRGHRGWPKILVFVANPKPVDFPSHGKTRNAKYQCLAKRIMVAT